MTDATTQNDNQQSDRKSGAVDMLWHMRDIRHSEPSSAARASDAITSCVGIIDTGCDVHHPCLKQCRITEIDFTAFEHGGTYGDERLDVKEDYPVDLQESLLKLGIEVGSDADGPAAVIHQLISDFAERDLSTCHLDIENPAHRYGHHGVACAGLIAAHSPVNDSQDQFGAPVQEIGFRGILPHCALLCISTPFGFDVKHIIRALLYCVASNVDVILIPRSIHRPITNSDSVAQDTRFSDKVASGRSSPAEASNGTVDPRYASTAQAESEALDWLIENISGRIPVVVASGNSGLNTPEYPAVSGWKNVIIAGAHNADGHLSSYTSGNSKSLTLTAPSDDEETSHAGRVRRFDKTAASVLTSSRIAPESATHASPYSIVSLGTVSRYRKRLTDDALYGDLSTAEADRFWILSSEAYKGYQQFGGTSAASAIVAGAVALLQQVSRTEHRRELTVKDIHRLLSIDVSSNTGIPRLNIEKAFEAMNG